MDSQKVCLPPLTDLPLTRYASIDIEPLDMVPATDSPHLPQLHPQMDVRQRLYKINGIPAAGRMVALDS